MLSHFSEENKSEPRLQPKRFMSLTFLSLLCWRELLIFKGEIAMFCSTEHFQKGQQEIQNVTRRFMFNKNNQSPMFLSSVWEAVSLFSTSALMLSNPWQLLFEKKNSSHNPKHSCHLCVGSCFPRRNVSISTSPSSGLLRGTKWPAPLIVTIVIPWYSTNLPATYNIVYPLHYLCLHSESNKWYSR